MPQPRLRDEWLALLADQFNTPTMRALRQFLVDEKAAGKTVYPPGSEIFSALEATPPAAVRAVVLGQDPYHGPGQAHGLCFSVRRGQPIPPSLRNIFTELEADLGIAPASHGDLSHWARQGVLLLNATLTVERGRPGSHRGRGWEEFTDTVVGAVNDRCAPSVFMLWGSAAQRKAAAIDTSRHCVLRAPHPSPLSAHRGFLGCRHFSQANAFLRSAGRGEIDWRLPISAQSDSSR